MTLKLKWADEDPPWRSIARCGGHVIKAFHDGYWRLGLGGISLTDGTAPVATLEAAKEAAEASVGAFLAEDDGLRALLGLRWIPVTERLPDPDVRVLIWTAAGEFSAVYEGEGIFKTGRVHTVTRADGDVTHWRPQSSGPEVEK